MDQSVGKSYGNHLSRVEQLSEPERLQYLWELDDAMLWEMYRLDCMEALVVLFRKYHRQIIVLVYRKLNEGGKVRLVIVQDAFSDLLERILAGKFRHEGLRKNFTAFAVHHLTFLVRTRLKLVANSRMDGLDPALLPAGILNHRPNVELSLDLQKVIDLIPRISNRVYRMVLYLIFILDYNSSDLALVLGQRSKAYDKRSRAISAFRKLLEEEGMLDELR